MVKPRSDEEVTKSCGCVGCDLDLPVDPEGYHGSGDERWPCGNVDSLEPKTAPASRQGTITLNIVDTEDGLVRMDFGDTPLKWLAFSPQVAQQVGKDLITRAAGIKARSMGKKDA